MKKKVSETPQKKGKHLSFAKRCQIETLLSEGQSYRYIAQCIGCSPSTVSREIQKHTLVKKSHTNDCLLRKDCVRTHVCGGISCRKKCKSCNHCKKYCGDYIQALCDILEEKGLCNSCTKKTYCNYEQRIYKAELAQNQYEELLVGRRNGFDLTLEQIEKINSQVSPLIKKGQSPYHIKQTLGKELCISESTLRRMIAGNELDVRMIDLRDAVRRKPRKKRKQMHNELLSPAKAGRMYEDFLEYTSQNEVSVIEMDCIEGTRENDCAILTLHFVTFHMQLYFIMPEHTSECVVNTLDYIEECVGAELFSELFEVLLTDNGHEFWDITGMERSYITGIRTKVFYCEPNRSDQKGACENNHKLFRYIVPKGTSIDEFKQSDITLITNHINSYRRKSLFGSSPYELAMKYIPEKFFVLLGLKLIAPEDVLLTPALLKTDYLAN